MTENRVRIRSDENVVKNAAIELLGADGEYHDIRKCVTAAIVTLEVGGLSRVHLDTILADVDVEAYRVDDETLAVFAHQLELHGWAVAPPEGAAAA